MESILSSDIINIIIGFLVIVMTGVLEKVRRLCNELKEERKRREELEKTINEIERIVDETLKELGVSHE